MNEKIRTLIELAKLVVEHSPGKCWKEVGSSVTGGNIYCNCQKRLSDAILDVEMSDALNEAGMLK